MNAEALERLTMAAESIARDVKRFVDACDANEREARETYGEPDQGESRRLWVCFDCDGVSCGAYDDKESAERWFTRNNINRPDVREFVEVRKAKQ